MITCTLLLLILFLRHCHPYIFLPFLYMVGNRQHYMETYAKRWRKLWGYGRNSYTSVSFLKRNVNDFLVSPLRFIAWKKATVDFNSLGTGTFTRWCWWSRCRSWYRTGSPTLSACLTTLWSGRSALNRCRAWRSSTRYPSAFHCMKKSHCRFLHNDS